MIVRVRIDDEMYEVEVGNLNDRPVLARVGGESFEVWPEEAGQPDHMDAQSAGSSPPAQPLPSPAIVPGPINKTNFVHAPIPGVILSISVSPGDSIAFGQELCILEAMKMKNIIRANRAGKIGAVCVHPGDQVSHGQVLIEYMD